VTDAEGNAVVAKTTNFTTGPGPDTVAPLFTQTSVQFGATVPTNFVFSLQFSKPMDPGSINSTTFGLFDSTLGQLVAGTISVSADLKTATFVPSALLTPGHTLQPLSIGSQDLSGNPQQNILCGSLGCFNFFLTVGPSADTTPPQVTETNPGNSLTNIGINALVQIEFSKIISPTSIGQVSLLAGSLPVGVTAAVTNMNQTLTLTPTDPLAANTVYTISIKGVRDFVGNTMAGTITDTFTTGPGADLTSPTILSITPAANTTVPDNTQIQIQFSKAMNPLTLDPTVSPGAFTLVTVNTSTTVPFTVSFSADFKTVTVTPTGGLAAATQYTFSVVSGPDASGNLIQAGASVNFTAQ